MGKSYTPKYRVEYRDNTSRTLSTMAWSVSRDGAANAANLEKWREGYNSSFNIDGSNWHVSEALGVVVHISRAWIIEQKTGMEIAETTMPMFEVA